MTMFLGKILDEGITAPKKIRNPLPPGVVYRDGKYYRKDAGEPKSGELILEEENAGNLQEISARNLKKST